MEEMNPVEQIKWLTENCPGKDRFARLASLVMEVGELAEALDVEAGNRIKVLKETSKEESVDCIITALSMYFAVGGTDAELVEIMQRKVDKWVKNNKEIKG